MKLLKQSPKKSLNKAYLKEKVNRESIESFKLHLRNLLDGIDESESEENAKNKLTQFLYNSFYHSQNEINTKGRIDLAIYEGKKPTVIIECKRPNEKNDFISFSDPNKKAMHELVLYYLRERIEFQNIEIKYLIATDVYQWFIFDEYYFDKYVFRNKQLIKDYENWKISEKDTKFFYESIAKPFIASLPEEVPATLFNLKGYESIAKSSDPIEENKLIPIFKILSPAHLLKQSFANDSNSLNKEFYNELLFIIGLVETSEGSKRLIQRKPEGERNSASLIENTITVLEQEDSLRKIQNPLNYGTNKEERTYNVALELCITWMNRILFLKLLEAQLLKFHQGNLAYQFLGQSHIYDYSDLNKLFFLVLAKKPDERKGEIKESFKNVPYLNSSLFEVTALEESTIKINSLDDHLLLKFYESTVLKDPKGKRRLGTKSTLLYFLEFLNSYDFTSEGNAEIQEDNKALVSASVLGLIFEKINGYKDGSFFTPGFITMYMCRESIRKSVVHLFNTQHKWQVKEFGELREKIEDRETANSIINSIKICDPAVGSGHFLVSALNEIIAIKSDLKILCYRNGGRIKNYKVNVENDELVIVDEEDDDIFEYKMGKGGKPISELQELQEALFHEKETIIENCLFGVDINANSVKICRLRLWIELLKHAYYTKDSGYTMLETLPNIDINIKQGNSLLSRFELEDDLGEVFRRQKSSLKEYRSAVNAYKSTSEKDDKSKLMSFIEDIKEQFKTVFYNSGPMVKQLEKYRAELTLLGSNDLFGYSKKNLKDVEIEKSNLIKKIEAIEEKIAEIKNNKFYKDAFEWRFEFPEVLDEKGNFVGFDVIVGNPPYVNANDLKKSVSEAFYSYLKNSYTTAKGTVDLYIYFFEKALSLIKPNSVMAYITPNRYLSASYGEALREFIFNGYTLQKIIDYSDVRVFSEASTYPILTFIHKGKSVENYPIVVGRHNEIKKCIDYKTMESEKLDLLEGYIWGFLLNEKIDVTEKIIRQSVRLDSACSVNATSTASEAELYHDIINEKKGYKLINTGTIDKYTSLWGEVELVDKGEKYLNPYLPKNSPVISDNRHALYTSPKIILAKIAITTEAFLDENGEYSSINTNCLHTFNEAFDPKYVLAWINSKLFQYTFECFFDGLKMSGGYLLYSAPNLSRMFIKEISPNDQKPFVALVNKIFKKKEVDSSSSTLSLEKEIDHLFYNTFDLSVNDINAIENK